jgi:SsrA-binding protein
MAAKSDGKGTPSKVVAHNRKARFNYQIGESFEAGIALTGTEVKSLRAGKATIAESYADSRGGEIWLINSNIPEYLQAGRFNHAPKRPRKLLLHRREIDRLVGQTAERGLTLVPTRIYFSGPNAKVEIALARGKDRFDKRESIREREMAREAERAMRDYRR